MSDTEFMITYGELVGEFFGAFGADGDVVEAESALKLTYDFGTAEVFAGASTYTELAAGVEFDVQGLTMSFDISGMSAGVDPSDNSILTPTSTLPDTLKFGLGAEFEYSDHLTISADLDTSTVADVNTTTAEMVVTLDFKVSAPGLYALGSALPLQKTGNRRRGRADAQPLFFW